MIEHGHQHFLYPRSRYPMPDGGEEVMSACVCGLEERRTYFAGAETPYRVSYRYDGLWLLPLDLLRLASTLRIEECDACHGEQPLGPCSKCDGLGILEDGEPLGQPPLFVKHS